MRFSGNSQPLKVLFVGSVNLNKGVPYVLDVARRLGDLIQVRMVGQLGVSAYGVSQLEQHVELLGPVPRGKVWEHYAWADVFFLPSLNEGSALVTYEALLSGLPVVCTPNTGSMVRDGFNGIIVPARDVVTMCEVLTRLATDTSYLEYLRANVAASRDDCSLSCYGERLIRCIGAPGSSRYSPEVGSVTEQILLWMILLLCVSVFIHGFFKLSRLVQFPFLTAAAFLPISFRNSMPRYTISNSLKRLWQRRY